MNVAYVTGGGTSRGGENEAHAECRRATARAWGAFLELALLDRLDDSTPVLEVVFALDPVLKRRLAEALAARPGPPGRE